MKAVVIIQARMGSTRLPGKVLADLAGQPMLRRVVERVRGARTISALMIATSTSPADDAIESFARQMGVPLFRGDEDDVLSRYAGAATASGAEMIVRVTADCPLLDPALVDRVVDALRAAVPRAAFAATTIVRSFPRGLDVEAMWAADFRRLEQRARQPYHREHVFPYAYEHPQDFPHISIADGEDRSWMRWTVDTPDDHAFVTRVLTHLSPTQTAWRQVVALIERHPDWLELNRHVVQKSLNA